MNLMKSNPSLEQIDW